MVLEVTVHPKRKHDLIPFDQRRIEATKRRDLAAPEDYDPNAPETSPAPPVSDFRPMGELSPGLPRSLRDVLTETMGNVGGDTRFSNDVAKRVMGLAEWNPLVGGTMALGDAYHGYQTGNPWEVATGLGFAGLNAMGVKPSINMFGGSLRGRRFPWGEHDPGGWLPYAGLAGVRGLDFLYGGEEQK